MASWSATYFPSDLGFSFAGDILNILPENPPGLGEGTVAKGLFDTFWPAVKLNPAALGAVNWVLKVVLLLLPKGGNDWLV